MKNILLAVSLLATSLVSNAASISVGPSFDAVNFFYSTTTGTMTTGIMNTGILLPGSIDPSSELNIVFQYDVDPLAISPGTFKFYENSVGTFNTSSGLGGYFPAITAIDSDAMANGGLLMQLNVIDAFHTSNAGGFTSSGNLELDVSTMLAWNDIFENSVFDFDFNGLAQIGSSSFGISPPQGFDHVGISRVSAVSEPETLLLLSAGLFGFGMIKRHKS